MKVNLKNMNAAYIMAKHPYACMKNMADAMISGNTLQETSVVAQRFAARTGIGPSSLMVAQSMRDAYYSSINNIKPINDVEIFYTPLNISTNSLSYAAIGIFPDEKYAICDLRNAERTIKIGDVIKAQIYSGFYMLPDGKSFYIQFIPDTCMKGVLNMNHPEVVKSYSAAIGTWIENVVEMDDYHRADRDHYPLVIPYVSFPLIAVPYHIYQVTEDINAMLYVVDYVNDVDEDLFDDEEYASAVSDLHRIFIEGMYNDDFYAISRVLVKYGCYAGAIARLNQSINMKRMMEDAARQRDQYLKDSKKEDGEGEKTLTAEENEAPDNADA